MTNLSSEMSITETVYSKNGVPIRLTDERWAHIMEVHGELAGLRLEIVETIANPTEIFAGNHGELLAVSDSERQKIESISMNYVMAKKYFSD
jgi:hypothetical protein